MEHVYIKPLDCVAFLEAGNGKFKLLRNSVGQYVQSIEDVETFKLKMELRENWLTAIKTT